MNQALQPKTIALLATDGFEDSELTQPMQAAISAGANVTVISDKTGEISGEHGTSVTVNMVVDDAKAEDFDGLILPGGVGNPDVLRTNTAAVVFVRDFFAQHKPVGAICHAPWMLVEAGVLDGRTVTSWPSLKTDIINAGATWEDKEVIVDQGLVTSRNPDDLPRFCEKVVEEMIEGKHEEQTV